MTKTNLITGFLGSGKTTSILHLLANKPTDEKWAVLVNEFGEVGIDGALLADSGALLKEIPGGCMCCVNGLPMQVGLNTLQRKLPRSARGGRYYRQQQGRPRNARKPAGDDPLVATEWR